MNKNEAIRQIRQILAAAIDGPSDPPNTVHVLKSVPAPFEAVWSGAKLHEVRRADRPFSSGDGVILLSYTPAPRAGWWGPRAILARIAHVDRPGSFGLPAGEPGLCVFSLDEIERIEARQRPAVSHDPPGPPAELRQPYRGAWGAFVDGWDRSKLGLDPQPAPLAKSGDIPRRARRR